MMEITDFTTNWRFVEFESSNLKQLNRQSAQPCELTIQIPQVPSVLELTCYSTARRAEVCHLTPPLNIPSYVCTLKGIETEHKTVDDAFLYQITYRPEGGLPSGAVIMLRTLSLQNPDVLILGTITVSSSLSSTIIPTPHGSPEQQPQTLSSPSNSQEYTDHPNTTTNGTKQQQQQQSNGNNNALSQMDEIKKMVESMAAESNSIDSANNPKQALMAAIARSALNSSAAQTTMSIPTYGAPNTNTHPLQQPLSPHIPPAISPLQSITTTTTSPPQPPMMNNSAKLESLIEMALGKLTLQQASLDALTMEVQAVRQENSELRQMVQHLVAVQALQRENSSQSLN